VTIQQLEIQDFSKGLDLVSSLNNIEVGYTPNAKNFRIAEYGGIEKILGYKPLADLGVGVSGQDAVYFQKRDFSLKQLVVASTNKWQSVSSAGAVADIRTGLTTNTGTTFALIEDVLYGVDIFNVMHKWSGAGATAAVAGTPPKGAILGVWSNQMWVAESSGSTLGMTVRWSEPGDFDSATAWPAANNVKLGGPGTSEKIIGGAAMPNGILIFTTNATYLIYDDATGANSLIDPRRGCSSRRSIAVIDGIAMGINSEGVFRTDGSFAQEMVSRRIDPLFVNEIPLLAASAGTSWFNSYLACFNRAGSAYNNLTLDIQAASGSVMANDYPVAAWVQGPLLGTKQNLFFIDGSNTRFVRQAFSGGSFLTAASPGVAKDITCYYELPFNDFGIESQIKRLHKIRLVGRGDLQVAVKIDYQNVTSGSELLGFPTILGGLWGTAIWDLSSFGGYSLFEGYARIRAKGRRISLRFLESSDDVASGRSILNADPFAELGSAGVYLVEPHYTVSTRNR